MGCRFCGDKKEDDEDKATDPSERMRRVSSTLIKGEGSGIEVAELAVAARAELLLCSNATKCCGKCIPSGDLAQVVDAEEVVVVVAAAAASRFCKASNKSGMGLVVVAAAVVNVIAVDVSSDKSGDSSSKMFDVR